mmetsp:Transcript_61773/g.122109  ORF Transcript_61773/g.122109 Transcript_61773/m.122109 type:complete len:225 (-) Transcript_61773:55-729(-)
MRHACCRADEPKISLAVWRARSWSATGELSTSSVSDLRELSGERRTGADYTTLRRRGEASEVKMTACFPGKTAVFRRSDDEDDKDDDGRRVRGSMARERRMLPALARSCAAWSLGRCLSSSAREMRSRSIILYIILICIQKEHTGTHACKVQSLMPHAAMRMLQVSDRKRMLRQSCVYSRRCSIACQRSLGGAVSGGVSGVSVSRCVPDSPWCAGQVHGGWSMR